MRTYGKTWWSFCVAGLALCTAGLAQGTDVEPEENQERDGQEVISAVQTRTQTQTDTLLQSAAPEGLDREQLTLTIRDRIRAFEEKREDYLNRLREQKRDIKGADEEQREQIRQKVREQRREWLRLAQQIRDRARTRLQEMKDALPSHRELLEQARERAREQVRERVEDARNRRVGVD
jgi:hypothetical protein